MTSGASARLAYALFARVARRRRRRALHPAGVVLEATLHTTGVGPGVFARAATHRGIVRFSRGVGTPPPLPDVFGLALRVPDAYGPGRHQDVLLSSARRGPLLQCLPVPTRYPLRQPFSSFLPFRFGDPLRAILAEAVAGDDHGRSGLGGVTTAAEGGRLRLTLTAAPVLGRGEPIATLEIGARLPPDAAALLRFDPWNTASDLRPWGPAMGLRSAAYAGSRRGHAEAAAARRSRRLPLGRLLRRVRRRVA